MESVTIYHNPKCGASRNVLELIRNAGLDTLLAGESMQHADRRFNYERMPRRPPADKIRQAT